MVLVVGLATEDHAATLQPGDEPRRFRHVRPLVHLVRRQHPRGERHRKMAAASASGCPSGICKDAAKIGQHEHRDVAVAVDEVAAQEVVRVDVVDAERTEKAPAENRHGLAAPCVGGPVHDAREQDRP